MPESRNSQDAWPVVYLASGSPRRRAILEELGIPYRVLAVRTEETVAATPGETVEENAVRKLMQGLRRAEEGAVIIGADTVLEVQGQVLGKPADEATALRYLQMLSGSRATAYSAVAVAVAGGAQVRLATETAEVHFRVLPPDVIRWYLATGEPMGRAGAFGIGQLGEVLTESAAGGYSCVSGLPKAALLLALASAAGGQMPEWLRGIPASLGGNRVQVRSIAVHPGA
ncbi:MAG: Maf family protein [Desulfobacterales bacterium]|jgi:septum formation protein|nr:Maf family protein [Desulfobacterales bacterium]